MVREINFNILNFIITNFVKILRYYLFSILLSQESIKKGSLLFLTLIKNIVCDRLNRKINLLNIPSFSITIYVKIPRPYLLYFRESIRKGTLLFFTLIKNIACDRLNRIRTLTIISQIFVSQTMSKFHLTIFYTFEKV